MIFCPLMDTTDAPICWGSHRPRGLSHVWSVHKCSVLGRNHHTFRHCIIREAFGIGIDKFIGQIQERIFSFDEDYKKKNHVNVYVRISGAKKRKHCDSVCADIPWNSAVDAHFPMEKLDFEEWGGIVRGQILTSW